MLIFFATINKKAYIKNMKCAFIYNPNSGKVKQEKYKDYIVNKLLSKYEVVDVFPSQKPRHATKLAKEACGRYDTLVVMGGDGTLSEVINGIAEEENKPVIGYIPHGTVNDVGHSLKLPRNVKKCIDVILKGKTLSHDIFKANDKYGIYVCCAGLFTETSYSTRQKDKKRIGKLAYFFHGCKKLLKTNSVDLKISFDGGEIEGRFAFVLVLNSRSVAGFKINGKAKLNDGKMDILLVKDKGKKVSMKGIFKVFSLFVCGLQRQGIRLRLDRFTVETRDDEVINIDGENAFTGGFDFQVLKNGIEIIVP